MHEMIRIQHCVLITALLVLLVCWMPAAGSVTAGGNVSIEELSSHPVQFIKNVGQSPDIIQYQAKSQDFSFDFTKDGLLVSGVGGNGTGADESGLHPLVVTLEGARTGIDIEAIDQLPGYANFLMGQNESTYKQHVPWYGEIKYSNILPGVNLSYTGENGVLKREYQVNPGADPKSIKLVYSGAENITLAADGSLIVKTKFGDLIEAAPVSYQEINGTHSEVSSNYTILDNNRVEFKLGNYNSEYPLIIDPYLQYSTYLGGSLEDYGMDIAIDSSGDAYVTGYTSSCNFPVVSPLDVNSPISYNGTFCHNSRDIFVTKLTSNSNGNASIVYSTFLGGSSSDFGRGIAVDSSNNVYITGDTYSSDFPVLLPIQNGGRLHGSNDAFVTKLRADGTNFWYSSYLGGNFADQANDIVVDSLGAAYITGSTVGNSPLKKTEENFPVTSGAYQESPNNNAVMGDGFVSKLSPTGNSLEYSSYISGSNTESGNGIAVDGQGMVYVVGTTSSDNLIPSTATGYQKALKGTQDAFLMKFNFAATSPLVYGTYLGGSTGYDYGEAVAVDSDFSAYVTGATASTDFPVTTYAKQKKKGWVYDYFEKDAYVTKFSTDGANLLYSTYLGGSSDDWGYGIAVDSSRRAYVTGYTKSESFPKYDSIKTITYTGDQDGFLTCVNADGSDWVYSTVFGGSNSEVSHAVAVSGDGNTVYITGWTNSPSIQDLVSGSNCTNDCFPVLNWINQSTYPVSDSSWYNGSRIDRGILGTYSSNTYDAFVMKFGKSSLLASFSPNLTCGPAPLVVRFNDTSAASANIVQRIWNFGDGSTNSTGSDAVDVFHQYNTTGTYQATLTLYSYTGSSMSNPSSITVCNPYISANFTLPGYNNTQTPIDVPWKAPISFSPDVTNYTPASYQWNFGDGTQNSTEKNPTHQFSSVGTYNVIMTPLTGTCCNYTSAQRAVRVMAPPYVSFTNTTGSERLELCPGAEVSFIDTSGSSSTNSSATAWEWNFGDNSATVTTQNVSHVYSIGGNFSVTLKASNVAGTSTLTKTNYVSVYGNVTSGFEASPVTGVAPLTVNFYDKSDGVPVTWNWKFDDANVSATSTSKNPSYTYWNPGVYSVNLSVWNKCGDPSLSRREDYITVNGNISPTLLFNETAPALYTKYNGTIPLSVFFQGDTSTSNLIDKAWWDFGDGNQSLPQIRDSTWPADNTWVNQTYTYNVVGDFTPVLKVLNNTWPNTSTTGMMYNQSIGVASPMSVSFTATPSSGVVTQPIQFNDTSSGSPKEWYWMFGDGSVTNVSGTPSHSFATSGSYPVLLMIWNKYGQYGGSTNQTIQINEASTSGTVVFSPTVVNLTTGSNNWRKVQVILNKADYGLSSFKIKLDLNSTNATNFGLAVDRPWWIDADKWSVTASPEGKAQYLTLSGLDTSSRIGFGAQNVSLGNITLYGSASGSAVMSLNVSASTAQFGESFMGLTSTSAPILVSSVGALIGYTTPPNDLKPDLTHDGLIDDFDGNGIVNSNDVTVFFQQWSKDYLNSYPVAPFDYNYNGVVDGNDIQKFFDAYSHW